MADANPEYARVPLEPSALRRTRISAIGDIPWGTHLCQFYQDKQDLIDILVPYFKAGLENNEFCMWVTAEPLRSAEGKAALAANVENLEAYIANGQLEIVDTEWYTGGGEFESDRVLQSWVDRLEAARRRGFAGLRLTGNPSWLERPEWHGFMEYEAAVDGIFGQRRMLAICTYSLSKCDALQIMDVISNHKFALVKRAGKWEVIAHEDTVIQKNRLTAVLEALPAGVALIDVQGRKVESNAAFDQVWAGPRRATRFEDHAACKAWWADTGRPVQPDEWASARAVRKGETVVNQELQIERFDGSRAFVLNSAAPIRDAHGRISGSAVAIEDVTNVKHAEEALRESESRFRALVTTTSDVVYRMSPDWKTMLSLRGRDFIPDTEEPSGTWLQKYIHPDDQPHVMASIGEAIRTKSTFELEHRIRRVDGSLGWTFSRAVPIQNANGEIVEWFGAACDITERKRVEEQLRCNQAQLIDSQRLANVGSWERDVATGKLRWSDQMYRIYGLADHAQPVFQTFLSLVHPKDLGIISEAQKRVLAANVPIEVEYRITRPDGEVRFIRSIAEVVTNAQGAPLRFVGTDQDITEQVKATELLRESEARLKSAERMAHVGNWIWDIKVNRVSCSEELLRILGQPPDFEPSYEESFQLVAPQDRERAAEWVEACLAKRRGSNIEARILRPDGDVRTVVCRSRVLLDEDGSPVRMFGTCQDVTATRRAQDEAFARQKLESLGTLASGIAHDFNNLLGAMLAQAELATAELATGSHADEALKQIREVAIRGSEIVRQLMIYAGREGDVLELTDLSKAVEGMLGLLQVSVSRHATIVTDLAENLPAVNARPAQLRQIVMNLVVNASDAIKDRDGIIRLTTRCATVGHDTGVRTSDRLAPGEYVELEVSDTGIGMSPETMSRVFDPFFTTKSAGRGLGLAVVHGIVRNLNGAIRVHSELGSGATFQILLPGAATAASATTGRVAGLDEAPAPSREATVLIVEDEHPLRLAVANMLGKAGFRVLQVDNGSEAIELLHATGEIDAILLDLTIPGAPSHEVLAEAMQVWPSIKIILTSAYSEETARAVLNGPQVSGYVRKPFQFEHLVRALRSVLASNVTAQSGSPMI
ncbi:MAG TPA: PAS domain-containing protein [Bryobacteraceae bacterium]|nr:PAS domain-containing protein [Bryobacteraceae bacterium]